MKKIISIIFMLIIISTISYSIFFNKTISKNIINSNNSQILKNKTKLISNIENFTIKGNSMEPLLKNGDKINVDFNYYKNQKPKKEEIILFNSSAYENYLIKIVKVTSKDNIEIRNKTLLINNQTMINSNNKIYKFSDKEIQMLKLYINSDNQIPQNSVLIFGDNIFNSKDSRKFGAVDSSQIIGKVIK